MLWDDIVTGFSRLWLIPYSCNLFWQQVQVRWGNIVVAIQRKHTRNGTKYKADFEEYLSIKVNLLCVPF